MLKLKGWRYIFLIPILDKKGSLSRVGVEKVR